MLLGDLFDRYFPTAVYPTPASIREDKEKVAKLRGAVWNLIEYWGQMFKFVTWINSKMRNRGRKPTATGSTLTSQGLRTSFTTPPPHPVARPPNPSRGLTTPGGSPSE